MKIRAVTRSLGVVAAAPALALLAACSGSGSVTASGTAGPAGVSTSTTAPASAPATSGSGGSAGPSDGPSSSGGSGSSAGSHGCPAGGAGVPGNAGKATTADLDGDGRADTIWLADQGTKRELGVHTASGATFSTTFTSAAPESAGATAGLVQGSIPLILLNTGRSAAVYTVHDCAIVETRNPQGSQYTFDHGFIGTGTGAGCPQIGSTRHLAGYLAKSTGSRFTVTRTLITLTDNGRRAVNGARTIVGTGLASTSSTVRAAQEFSCGSGNAALEPQS